MSWVYEVGIESTPRDAVLSGRIERGRTKMANPEHVEVVKRGRQMIAQWRREHPGETLDLRGADLRGADLSLSNLTEADLYGARLLPGWVMKKVN